MVNINPEIEQSWKVVLLKEFNKDYFIKLKQFLLDEKKHHSIYPKGKDIFKAFHYTPFDRVKVVILKAHILLTDELYKTSLIR